MPTMRCSNGHTWDHPNSANQGKELVRCPECGEDVDCPAAATVAYQLFDHVSSTLVSEDAGKREDAVTIGLPSASATQQVMGGPGGRLAGTLPGYEILAELGRGGMGVVYKARQLQLKRLVAIKMILAGPHASLEALQRFRTEAEAIAQFDHPNIVQVYEIGEFNGLPYLALEYCAGGSLERKLEDAPLTARAAAELLATLARAMGVAHAGGVVHRDLKPANVLLMENGTPKITDFGLAKKLEEEGSTLSGSIVGTPSYMSPEQAAGKTKDVGPAADIYALGALLYKVLTGRPPFRAPSTLDTVLQVINNEPVPPRQLQPTIPRDLETICLKCLAKHPRRRYPTAEALADDLDRVLSDRPILARPVGIAEHAVRWCRRHPLVAGLLSLAMVLTLMLFAVASVGYLTTHLALTKESAQRKIAESESEKAQKAERGATKARDDAQKAEKEAEKARDEAVEQRDRIARNLYVAHMRLAHEELQHGQIGKVAELLQPYGPDADLHQLTGWEWCYLQGAYRREVVRSFSNLPAKAVAWDPNGHELAVADGEGLVRILSKETGKEVHRLPGHFGVVEALAYTADGKWLVSGGADSAVKIWDPVDGNLIHSTVKHSGGIVAVAANADRKAVASADLAGGVRVWNLEGNVLFSAQLGSAAHGLDWSRDGKLLSATGYDRNVRVWELANPGKAPIILGYPNDVPQAVAFSPDGAKLAVQGWAGPIVWDLESRKVVWGAYKLDLVGRTIHWSPDGRSLAVGCDNSMVKILDANTGKLVRNLANHGQWVYSVRWAPDSKSVASASLDKTVKIQNVEAGRGLTDHSGHVKEVWTVAWSPDGDRLATGGTDKSLRIWNMRTGREEGAVHGLPGIVRAAAWDPAGKRLAVSIYDGGVQIFDGETRQLLGRLDGIIQWQGSVYWSADAKKVYCSGWDGTVRIHAADSGKWLRTIHAGVGRVNAVSPSPDGRYLAVTGADTTVRLWHAESGRLARSFAGHIGEGVSATWSPDGLRFATSAGDGTIAIWDAATGKAIRFLRGHTAMVYGVDWSPDGRRLASASSDESVKLWAADTGEELLTFHPNVGPVLTLAWSKDGRKLAIGGGAGAVKVWDATPGYQDHHARPTPTPSPEDVEKSAQLLVASLFDEGLTQEAILKRLEKMATLSPVQRAAGVVQTRKQASHRATLRSVDLRPEFAHFELKPKRQGLRNSCSVCVVTSALEFALARARERGEPLSIEYLNWSCNQIIGNTTADRGQFFHHLLQGYERFGICPEKDWPYQPRFDGARQPPVAARQSADVIRKANVKAHWIRPWHKESGLQDEHIVAIKRTLDQGWPVCAGSTHSLLIVGYREDPAHPGGGVFFCADSGRGGFVELAFENIKTTMTDLFWIEGRKGN